MNFCLKNNFFKSYRHFVFDPEQMTRAVETSDFPTLRSFFEQLMLEYLRSTRDEYQMVTQLPENHICRFNHFRIFCASSSTR